MTIIILEKVPLSLRGELTRWLLEPKSGVFLGKISPLVREKLWEKVCHELRPESAALLVWSAPTEQGFLVRIRGERQRNVTENEGLLLIRRPHPNPQDADRKLNAFCPWKKDGTRQPWADLPDVQI